MILIVISMLVASSQTFAIEKPSKMQKALQKLEKSRVAQLKWNEETDTPNLLTGSFSRPSNHSPAWIAYEFLNKYKALYGLQNPVRDMKVIKVEYNPDRTFIHFQHLLFQIPVWGDKLIFEIGKDGVIRRVEGTIYPDLEKIHFNRPMHAAISEKQAVSKALASIGIHNLRITMPDCQAYYLPTRKGTPLIYVVKVRLSEQENSVKLLFIHSLTGKTIDEKVVSG
ncbi:hypothetical protein [Paenibacillus montanisoli]|nr:hypothetical protein [Paenibacillus montanisoli]